MQLTMCDRCGGAIAGHKAIVGLWAEDGIRGSDLPSMSNIPAVTVMNLCGVCRVEVEKAIRGFSNVLPL